MDLGSPLPSAGEGLEVRGRSQSWGAHKHFQILIQRWVSGVD